MGNRLEGRVAIVTGSGRGIGAACAKLLAEEGAAVVVNDIGGAVDGTGEATAPADETVNDIIAAGGRAVANYDSVAEFDSAGKIVQAAIDNFGRLDILAHPAGILRDRMVFNMTEYEWDGVLQVHLYGAFNMVKHAVPHMIKQNYGRIVLFSSGSGLGSSGQSNYAMAKEGMVGMARALAPELAPYGITINAVYPGAATRMTATVPQSSRDLRARPPGCRRPWWTRRAWATPRTTRPKSSTSARRRAEPSRARSSAPAVGSSRCTRPGTSSGASTRMDAGPWTSWTSSSPSR